MKIKKCTHKKCGPMMKKNEETIDNFWEFYEECKWINRIKKFEEREWMHT